MFLLPWLTRRRPVCGQRDTNGFTALMGAAGTEAQVSQPHRGEAGIQKNDGTAAIHIAVFLEDAALVEMLCPYEEQQPVESCPYDRRGPRQPCAVLSSKSLKRNAPEAAHRGAPGAGSGRSAWHAGAGPRRRLTALSTAGTAQRTRDVYYQSHALPLQTNHQHKKPTKPPTTTMTVIDMPAMAPLLRPPLLTEGSAGSTVGVCVTEQVTMPEVVGGAQLMQLGTP